MDIELETERVFLCLEDMEVNLIRAEDLGLAPPYISLNFEHDRDWFLLKTRLVSKDRGEIKELAEQIKSRLLPYAYKAFKQGEVKALENGSFEQRLYLKKPLFESVIVDINGKNYLPLEFMHTSFGDDLSSDIEGHFNIKEALKPDEIYIKLDANEGRALFLEGAKAPFNIKSIYGSFECQRLKQKTDGLNLCFYLKVIRRT